MAAGTAAIGRRSDGVVLERGSRRIPRRRKWSSGRNHRSKLGSGWRGWDCFSCSSRLTCQRNCTQAPLHGVIMMWYGSQGLLLACRLPAARVSAAGAQHAAPASLHDLQGSRKVRAPALGGLCARQNKRNASEEHGDIFEEQTSSPRAFDWYLDSLLTPTGRLNRHILGEPPPPDPGFRHRLVT